MRSSSALWRRPSDFPELKSSSQCQSLDRKEVILLFFSKFCLPSDSSEQTNKKNPRILKTKRRLKIGVGGWPYNIKKKRKRWKQSNLRLALAVREECHPSAIMSFGALVTKGAMWLADNICVWEILRRFVRMHPWLAGLSWAVWNNQSTLDGQLSICTNLLLACEKYCQKCWTPVLQVAFRMLQYLGAKVLRSDSVG